jgi:hypothetical protein
MLAERKFIELRRVRSSELSRPNRSFFITGIADAVANAREIGSSTEDLNRRNSDVANPGKEDAG